MAIKGDSSREVLPRRLEDNGERAVLRVAAYTKRSRLQATLATGEPSVARLPLDSFWNHECGVGDGTTIGVPLASDKPFPAANRMQFRQNAGDPRHETFSQRISRVLLAAC